jgi:hypothetical protein
MKFANKMRFSFVLTTFSFWHRIGAAVPRFANQEGGGLFPEKALTSASRVVNHGLTTQAALMRNLIPMEQPKARKMTYIGYGYSSLALNHQSH